MMHAETVLDIDGGRGERVVRRRRRTDDQVDVGRGQACAIQRLLGRRSAQRGGRLSLTGDVALLDAGALDDPLVRGFDQAFEIAIGHHRFGSDAPKPRTTERIMDVSYLSRRFGAGR